MTLSCTPGKATLSKEAIDGNDFRTWDVEWLQPKLALADRPVLASESGCPAEHDGVNVNEGLFLIPAEFRPSVLDSL